MRTIAEMLRWRARRHPSLPAVWFEGKSQGYGELDASSAQLAAGFVAKLGLAPGDRVAILDKNSAAYLELFFALDKAGLVAAPLNWRLTPHEVKQIIDDIKPRLIVIGPEFKAHVAGINVPAVTFADLPRGGEDPMRDLDGAVCCQFCTSGTTGLPKGAMLTGWNVLNVGLCIALEIPEIREGGRHLVCLPMFHIGGAGWAIWAMQQGSAAIIVRETVPDLLLKTMVEQKVETALLAPTLMLFLTELPQARGADFSALKYIIYGTAPISPDLLRRSLETFKCRFSQLYGLTETTGPFTSLGHEYHSGERLWSCGRPMFGGRVRVVDAEDNDLPPHQVGEILYQGENLMTGYWAREEASAEAMRGGWFHTGDAGYLDADGFIFLKDRIRDMIVSGGENVYPAEVEREIAAHPAIAEVVVIGVPDAQWGEAIKAVCSCKSGQTATAQEIIDFVGERIARYKRPKYVAFVDAMPKTAAGAIDRAKVKEAHGRA